MRFLCVLLLLVGAAGCHGRPVPPAELSPIDLPPAGHHQLRILTPLVLELELVSSKPEWDFTSVENLPSPSAFEVRSDGRKIPVQRVGFRRRVAYAPLNHDDLRIGNHLYFGLALPLAEGAKVTVENLDRQIWKPSIDFKAVFRADRLSPAIHVNQSGYAPGWPKQAFVGCYLGDLGELDVPTKDGYDLVEETTGKKVFHGSLSRRLDVGYTFPCYQQVFGADFSAFRTPGVYRLSVPGMGQSLPFAIDEGIPAFFARAYALGLYHQRCGRENALPFSRFTHKACHTAAASVPTMDFKSVNEFLRGLSREMDEPQAAPPLSYVDASLFPFINQGKVDVSGGHHDAGDYSKYTINSCQLVHHLIFAADAFPGVVELDNLGLPESGDGKSDILQEAKYEADFLAKMQDADGGFYFLIYPRDRKYEDDVLPDHGDPQVVFPKNTSATAAATAALAQAGSSPAFKKQFPAEAAFYLEKAKRGWDFLQKAWAKYGRAGAYQRITHYGDFAGDRDEIEWAAVEIYLATGDESVHKKLVGEFDPSDERTRRWGWWSLYESFGCAARSYGFAEKTGRIPAGKLNEILRDKCLREILTRADDVAHDARFCAYNTSFPEPSKRFRNGGWYFPSDTAFDITVGYQLDPRPEFIDAVVGNLNYEAGANPVNVSFITGTGWRRQREIVDQYAHNDARVLPPSGIPLGSIQSGFAWLNRYKDQLSKLSYPSDGDEKDPYPFYDRWGDSFNVQTEFTILCQSRALASLAFWMAQSPLKTQQWKPAGAKIIDAPSGGGYQLDAPGLNPRAAFVVWEASGQEPAVGPVFKPAVGASWIEAEAVWPDGRRVFARRDL